MSNNKKIRFEFGKNWNKFLGTLDENKIDAALKSLSEMLALQNLSGKTFLDIGSGSGLFSLSAIKLGAKQVYSFDYDLNSVECTKKLKEKFFPDIKNWTIEQGSILDTDYINRLGQFDIVYSWGVLHHTGDMWKALENVIPLIKKDGKLFIAIYNDQGFISKIWKIIKIIYNKLPNFLKPLYVLIIISIFEFKHLLAGLFKQKKYCSPQSARGMSKYYDWVDWLGGDPFEVAKPGEIISFYEKKGFLIEKLKTCGNGYGNNEFVFVR